MVEPVSMFGVALSMLMKYGAKALSFITKQFQNMTRDNEDLKFEDTKPYTVAELDNHRQEEDQSDI